MLDAIFIYMIRARETDTDHCVRVHYIYYIGQVYQLV